ncbi:hypothetical protein J6590_061042 [Homalodisca vitripennis]|nr:hypothetical protein J6590_061042 [Homalodisca vitripennis]
MCNTLVVLLVVCTTVWVPALPANPLKMITNRLPRMSVQVERLEPCPDPADTPIQFTNLVISQVGLNRFIISGQINITETLDRPILSNAYLPNRYQMSWPQQAGSKNTTRPPPKLAPDCDCPPCLVDNWYGNIGGPLRTGSAVMTLSLPTGSIGWSHLTHNCD